MSDTNLARPPVGLGHMSLTVADVEASHRFYTAPGLRAVGHGVTADATPARRASAMGRKPLLAPCSKAEICPGAVSAHAFGCCR